MFSFEPYYPQTSAIPTQTNLGDIDEEGAVSSFYPQPPVTLLTVKNIPRTFAAPLKVQVYYGALDDFLENHHSDALVTSCYKGSFSKPGTSTFGVAAKKCGIDASTLTYSNISAHDYNLHEVFLTEEQKQFFKHLWMVELMQPSAVKPFKHKHLITLYNTLKVHAHELVEGVESITIPLIGKGSEKGHFLTGAYEVIVELIGWLYHVSDYEKDSQKIKLNTVNVITHNVISATHLDTTFEKLVPFHVDKSLGVINELLDSVNNVLRENKERYELAVLLNKAHKWRAMYLSKTEQLWMAVRQGLEDINNALFIFQDKIDHAKNLLLVCCAANARIIAENAAKLLAFKIEFESKRAATGHHTATTASTPFFGSRGRGERGRGRATTLVHRGRGGYRGRGGSLRALRGGAAIRGGGRGDRGDRGHAPTRGGRGGSQSGGGEKEESNKKTLSERVKALKGQVDFKVFASLQTIRLIGNKTVHPAVFKATLVDISAIIAALHILVPACIL